MADSGGTWAGVKKDAPLSSSAHVPTCVLSAHSAKGSGSRRINACEFENLQMSRRCQNTHTHTHTHTHTPRAVKLLDHRVGVCLLLSTV